MKLFHSALLTLAATTAVAQNASSERKWWKEAVAYQVYPASFKETRGPETAIGWGDINGITEKLDHFVDLGVDIVWISPFYDSPMRDLGYDISNYDSVDYRFGGKIKDIKRLVKGIRKRGLKIIFDLVINHTSDQHYWFQHSKTSKDSKYRDWYFWRPGKIINGTLHPPNNWSGNNNGSAWWYDNTTGEYYLGVFNSFQPDLNWDNPITRQAIFDDALKFWLSNMGIDGFRMDAFSIFSKPAGLPSYEPCPTEYCNGRPLFNDGPHEHEYLHQLNVEALQPYGETFTVGEYGTTYNMTVAQSYVSAARQEVNTAFITNMVDLGRLSFGEASWNLTGMRAAIDFLEAVGSPENGDGWNTIYLENHDLPRSITRFANDSAELRVPSAKMLAMLIFTLSGTTFIYQMEEIGMVDVPGNWTIDDYVDFAAKDYYYNATENGVPVDVALSNLRGLARDNARTPFNWNSTGGFSPNATTWTKQVWASIINLADQRPDPDSVYNFYKQMIVFRKRNKDLYVYGAYELLDMDSENFLVYQKTAESGDRAIVILNWSNNTDSPPVQVPYGGTLVAHTHNDTSSSTYQPYEGRVYEVSA